MSVWKAILQGVLVTLSITYLIIAQSYFFALWKLILNYGLQRSKATLSKLYGMGKPLLWGEIIHFFKNMFYEILY